MVLKIKSKQLFENHMDEFTEEHECKFTFLEDGFEICYDKCSIRLTDNIVYISKPELNLQIINDSETRSSLKTPYGSVELLVKGINFNWNKSPFEFNIKYSIKLENTAEYINELQMSITDK